MEIGVWGDSITYGEGDSEALGWVGRLRRGFLVNENVQIYNRGVCGDTSEDVLKRFAIEVASIKPTSTIFAIGINDSKCRVEERISIVSIEKFNQNMQTLVEQTQMYTDKIFIVGATRVDEEVIAQWKDSAVFSNAEIEKYNEVLKDSAKNNNLQYIDVFNALSVKSDLCDGLHPKAGGYEKLAQIIKEKIFT